MPVDGTGSTGGDQVSAAITVTYTEAAAVCSVPTSLTVTNVTSISADLSWTTGGASIWETEVVPTGNTPTGHGVATVTTTETLANLSPGTTYDAYVRDVCSSSLMITGAFDGPLTGGQPKGIELYAVNDIGDLSVYGIGSANNGGGTDGQEFTFPAVSVTAGTYIYVAHDSTGFSDYMGFPADYIASVANVNGDDAFELFINGTVIDVFGDINCDPNSGTNQCPTNVWEYLDGWAYRTSGEVNNMGIFDTLSWTFSGPNALDGCTTNGACASQIPVGTFTTDADTSDWAGPVSFTTLCNVSVSAGVDQSVCGYTLGIDLSGSISGASAGTWSTLGTGSFSDFSSLSPIYFPSAADTVAGSVMNVLTSTAQGACLSISDTMEITFLPDISANAGSDQTVCSTTSNVSLSGSVMVATGGLWTSNGTGTFNSTTSLSTDYVLSNADTISGSVMIYLTTTGNGTCLANVDSMEITIGSGIYVNVAVNNSVSCNGGTDGAVTATASGGLSTLYAYSWSNGMSTATISGLNAMSYTVIVSSGGCTATDAVTLTEPAPIGAVVTVTDATTAGGTDGTATAVVSPSSSYTYLWNNASQTNQTATGYSAGTATVTVTENSGNSCSQVASGVVADPASCNITVSLNVTNISCNGATDGEVTAVASGGPSTLYSYSWSNGMSTATISALNTMSYTVTVNSGSCSATNAVTLTEPSVLNLTMSSTLITCKGGSDGTATTAVSGGTTPYTYTWSNGSTDIATSGLSADTLSSLVTDANSCTISGSTTITEPIAITGTDAVTICFGDSVLLGGNYESVQGTYTDIQTSLVNGCDSMITVSLATMNGPNAGRDSVGTVCFNVSSFNLMTLLIDSIVTNGGTWFDDDATGVLTDSIFAPNGVGIGVYNFTYVAVGVAPCVNDSSTVQVTVEICGGVDDVNSSMSVEIYPNPSTGLFTLQLNGWDMNKTSLTISGIDGRELYQQKISSSSELIEWKNAAAGIYFVTVKQNDVVVVRQLIVE